MPPHRKNQHYTPGQSRPPSRMRSVAPSLPPIPVQPLASLPQSGPCGVCMGGRRTKGSCRSRSSTMSCCWIGRGGNFADKRGAIPDHLAPIVDRLGLNRSNWVETVHGFGRLFKQAAGRPSSLVDGGRTARGAGSRARRRLEPPLCRPLARRRAVNRHLHYAFTQGAWPPRAQLAARRRLDRRTVQLLTSSDHAHDGRLDSVGLRPPRVSESGCAGRLPRTDELVGVWILRRSRRVFFGMQPAIRWVDQCSNPLSPEMASPRGLSAIT